MNDQPADDNKGEASADRPVLQIEKAETADEPSPATKPQCCEHQAKLQKTHLVSQWVIAGAAITGLIIAGAYSCFAYHQWKVMENAERASLVISRVDFEPIPDKKTFIWVELRNVGRTPALGGRVAVRAIVTASGTIAGGRVVFEDQASPPPRITSGLFYRSDVSDFVVPNGESTRVPAPITLGQDQIAALQKGGRLLYVVGKVKYSDRLGTADDFYFCRLYDREMGRWVFCDLSNEQGRHEAKP